MLLGVAGRCHPGRSLGPDTTYSRPPRANKRWACLSRTFCWPRLPATPRARRLAPFLARCAARARPTPMRRPSHSRAPVRYGLRRALGLAIPIGSSPVAQRSAHACSGKIKASKDLPVALRRYPPPPCSTIFAARSSLSRLLSTLGLVSAAVCNARNVSGACAMDSSHRMRNVIRRPRRSSNTMIGRPDREPRARRPGRTILDMLYLP